MAGLASECCPMSCCTRSAISAAALLVKVTARMRSAARFHAAREVGDAIGDDPRLARARPGQNEHRPTHGFHRLALLRIELL